MTKFEFVVEKVGTVYAETDKLRLYALGSYEEISVLKGKNNESVE